MTECRTRPSCHRLRRGRRKPAAPGSGPPAPMSDDGKKCRRKTHETGHRPRRIKGFIENPHDEQGQQAHDAGMPRDRRRKLGVSFQDP